MDKTRLVLLVTLAALMTTPSAAAVWHAWGSTEPSTPHDRNDGMMFTDPDTTACTTSGCTTNKVYFAGFYSPNFETGVGPNPNVGTISTEIEPPEGAFYALLGVWKDCNKDGFVGLGDQGLFEYRSTLLLDTSVCPAGSIPTTIPSNWVPPHNDGAWVHEFLPIAWPGPYSSGDDVNKFNINDAGARAWYDFGQPDDNGVGLTCWINPPTDSMHSTGGLVYWADCLATGYQGTDTFDSVADQNALLQPYSFSDANRTQYDSNSRANFENPYGRDSEQSYATVWACGPETQVAGGSGAIVNTESLAQTLNDNTVPKTFNPVYLNVSQPRVPPAVSPTAPTVNPTSGPIYVSNGHSAAGTVNQTAAGFDQCGGNTASGGGFGGSTANTPYAAEAPVANKGAGKTQSDGVLVGVANAHRPDWCPRTDSNGDCLTVGPASDDVGGLYQGALGQGTPPGLGQHDVGVASASIDGFWYDAIASWVTASSGTQTQSVTFYAHVSSSAISTYGLWLPGGSTGVAPTAHTYGQEACAGATTGIVNGWDCASSDWWQDASQSVSDISQTSPWLGPDSSRTGDCTPSTTGASTDATERGCAEVSPYVGDGYELRDVNCYDDSTNTLRSVVGPVNNPPAVGGTENGCALNAGSP